MLIDDNIETILTKNTQKEQKYFICDNCSFENPIEISFC